MLIPLSARLRERLELVTDPVQPQDAATIAVVRDGENGLEAFLMRRQATMRFAAGMYVFPGGRVDHHDQGRFDWAGPSPEDFADRFNCSVTTAHSLVVAAARETFEETGVLLAGADEHSVVEDTTEFHDARIALERHELTFQQFLQRHDLVLRADLLGAWAHWITPNFEPARYDTRFFVAVMPAGQRIDTVSDEADHSLWAPLGEVLSAVDQGTAAMMPPTAVTCRELSVETSATVLVSSAQREIRPIEPRIVFIDGEYWLETESAEQL